MFKENGYCMKFSNKDIFDFLVKPLMDHPKIKIRILSGDEALLVDNVAKDKPIDYVCFDGNVENFHISFYGHQASIFITDESSLPECGSTFNEEFMFIDDNAKLNITSSDTYGNIVYEGNLRTMTQKEILELFREIILLLVGAMSISVKETVVLQEGCQYPKCDYVVKVKNESPLQIRKQVENIQFEIN